MSDTTWMQRAIDLAIASEAEGNVPVGAVIVLDGEVVGEGWSRLLEPEYHPGRHAEVEALRSIPVELWPRAREMTCYSTLEPCVMCAGTLLLHGIGRVVWGAKDRLGGASPILDNLPAYYDEGGVYRWEGPLMPEACDALYTRADALFADLPVGRRSWEAPKLPTSADACLTRLAQWRENPDSGRRQARKDLETYARDHRSDPEGTALALPYARAIFEATGYLKDYRLLKKLSRRAGDHEHLERVQDRVREDLPDVWMKRALDRGDVEAALECWYEAEEHRRSRHAADAIVRAAGDDDPELVISCRMSQIEYYVGRRKRRHYRRSCTILRKLRDELEAMGHGPYWDVVVEDLRDRYDFLRAFRDELERAFG